MTAPLSIIILTKNSERHLPALLNQLFDGMMTGLVAEVILADCNSTDATAKIADEAGALFFNDGGSTSAERLNHAAKSAKGQWLLCIKANASLSNGWSEHAREHIKDHAGLSATFSKRKGSKIALAVQGFSRLLPGKKKLSISDGILIPAGMFGKNGGFGAGDTPVLNALPETPRRLDAHIESQSA